jgi:hypothetical protein
MATTGIVPPDLPNFVGPGEHLALLVESGRFDRLLRKDDLLDEGVAAVFGLVDGRVELLALCFHLRNFTAGQAAAWLAERGIARPVASLPAGEG